MVWTKTDAMQDFEDILNDDSYGIFCAPTTPELALKVLSDYILGPEFYVTGPGATQANTEIVDRILAKVSKDYRWGTKKSPKRLFLRRRGSKYGK